MDLFTDLQATAAGPTRAPRPRVLPHLPLERAERARYSASASGLAVLTRCLTWGSAGGCLRLFPEFGAADLAAIRAMKRLGRVLRGTRAALTREAARLHRGSAP